MRTLLSVLICLACAWARGATTNTAINMTLSAVNSAMSGLVAGDYLKLPGGSGDWTGDLTVTPGVIVLGNGGTWQDSNPSIITSGKIKITKHATKNTGFIGLKFTGGSAKYQINGADSAEPFLVANCWFNDGAPCNGGNNCPEGLRAQGGVFWSNVWYSVGSGGGGGADNLDVKTSDSHWSESCKMGVLDTDGKHNIYFEDCIFTNQSVATFDSDQGCEIVMRWSTWVDSAMVQHGGGSGSSGNDTSITGGRCAEVYNNRIIRVNPNQNMNRWAFYRGGSGVWVSNNMDTCAFGQYPGKPDILLGVGCPGAYPRRYQVGQVFASEELVPTFPLLIFGNTGAAPSDSNFISISQNPNNACGTPTSYIVLGRDYYTNNAWNWQPYPYPHWLRTNFNGAVGGGGDPPPSSGGAIAARIGAGRPKGGPQ